MAIQIVIYPLDVRSGDDSDSYKSSIQGVVTKHSDEEWHNLIREFKKKY